MARSPAVAGRGHSLPSACPTAGKPAACSGWRPSLQSVRRINCSTVSARMPNIRWHITLPGPRTLTCRPRRMSRLSPMRQRLPLPLGHLRSPAGVDVNDRHMAQRLTEGPDLGRVIGAVHQVVEAVDPARRQPRQRDGRLVHRRRGEQAMTGIPPGSRPGAVCSRSSSPDAPWRCA